MPNWCENSVTIYNPKEFVDKCCKDGYFNFDNIIPMPEHMRVKNKLGIPSWAENQIGEDHLTIEHIQKAEQLQNELFQEDVFDYIAAKPWLEAEEERTGINADDWYEWNREHWGTKWDLADEVKIAPEDFEHGVLNLCFDTAWTPPIPVFEKMAELGISFEFKSEEPGCEIYMSGESCDGHLCYSYDDPPKRDEDGNIIEEDEDEQDA